MTNQLTTLPKRNKSSREIKGQPYSARGSDGRCCGGGGDDGGVMAGDGAGSRSGVGIDSGDDYSLHIIAFP